MPMPPAAPLEKRLYREDTYQTLKNWIIEGTLLPLEKVRDLELAQQLGVSRTPVREALRRLEDEGLVETKTNAWTRVAAADASLAQRVYPILRVLEPLALELSFSGFVAADFAAMKHLNQAIQHHLEHHHAKQAALEDTALHRLWTHGCQNPELIAMIEQLKTNHIRLEIFYWTDTPKNQESILEHGRIVKALEQKDLRAAQNQLEAHWTRALSRWEQR